MKEFAPGVGCLPIGIANVYFVGRPGGQWAVIDAAVPNSAGKIRAAAEARYGAGARPEAVLLTHGHADHAGSALALADAWDVPLYAHPLELPYLDGRSAYPPPDTTVGGALAFLCRLFPPTAFDLRPRLHALPPGGAVPGLPDWRWLPTPGHAPGHVSFFREADRTLIAGDAFAAVDLDSVVALLTQTPQLSRPPTPMTCDWGAARKSVEDLAALAPLAVGCGHGTPLTGPTAAADLARLAATFAPPAHGRYVPEPARTGADGVLSLPPPASDPLPARVAVYAGVAAVALGALALARSDS